MKKILMMILIVLFITAFLTSSIKVTANPTVIDSLPYVINSPGTYIVEADLSSSNDGIIVNSPNVTIIGNKHTITGSGTGKGIEINNYSVTIKDLEIIDFEYGIYAEDIYNDKAAITGPYIYNVVINACNYGIYLSSIYTEGGVIIENATILSSEEYGIYSEGIRALLIKNTVIHGSNSGDNGIYLESNINIYVYNVTVSDSGNNGIEILNSEYITIVSSITSNNGGNGIYMKYTFDLLLLDDIISGNNGNGIDLNIYSNIYIVSSTISDNKEFGIETENSTSYYSYNLYVYNNSLTKNENGGIFISNRSKYTYIGNNQLIENNGYAVYSIQENPELEVSYNVFWENNATPQAYDMNGVGDWHNNYWSDLSGPAYTFSNNTDNSPLANPLYDLQVTDVNITSQTPTGNMLVQATLSNPTPGLANNISLVVSYTNMLQFDNTPFIWINNDIANSTSVSGGDTVTDYGNYTLWDLDDEYFVYKLPWTVNILGEEYNYISITTNGYIEFLKTENSVMDGDYSVYENGYFRTEDNDRTETYGLGVTILFAYSGDLYASHYTGVFNYGDKLVIEFNGSTYEDNDPTMYPVKYEIIIYRNGTILVSLGDIKYTMLDGLGYTGIYYQPLGLEIPAGYMLAPNTTYKINLEPTNVTTRTNITLEPFETKNITLPAVIPDPAERNTYKSFWIRLLTTPGESDPYNNLKGPEISMIPPAVGGVLEPSYNHSRIGYNILAGAIVIIMIYYYNKNQ